MARADAEQLPVIMYRQVQEKGQGKPCRFILKKRVSQVQQGEEKETKPVKKAGGEEKRAEGNMNHTCASPWKRAFFKRTLKTVRSLRPLRNPSKSSPNPTLKETLRKSRLSYGRLIYPTTTQSLQATRSRSCWVSSLSIAKEPGHWAQANSLLSRDQSYTQRWHIRWMNRCWVQESILYKDVRMLYCLIKTCPFMKCHFPKQTTPLCEKRRNPLKKTSRCCHLTLPWKACYVNEWEGFKSRYTGSVMTQVYLAV